MSSKQQATPEETLLLQVYTLCDANLEMACIAVRIALWQIPISIKHVRRLVKLMAQQDIPIVTSKVALSQLKTRLLSGSGSDICTSDTRVLRAGRFLIEVSDAIRQGPIHSATMIKELLNEKLLEALATAAMVNSARVRRGKRQLEDEAETEKSDEDEDFVDLSCFARKK
jgi:hypothetical protein